MKSVSIYLHDLTLEAQKKVLDAAGIKNAREANWDVFPLTELEFEENMG